MKSIALDPGHFASAGAHGNGLDEARWALNFANRVAHYIRAAGHVALLTRKTEKNVESKMRGKIAKAAGCDAFLSIHLNAAGSSQAHGCEAFTVPSDERSAMLGMRLVGEVTKVMEFSSRGVKVDSQSQHSSLTVLRTTYKAMPAVLIEVGFVSNAGDAARLKDARLVENLAMAFAEGMVR